MQSVHLWWSVLTRMAACPPMPWPTLHATSALWRPPTKNLSECDPPLVSAWYLAMLNRLSVLPSLGIMLSAFTHHLAGQILLISLSVCSPAMVLVSRSGSWKCSL